MRNPLSVALFTLMLSPLAAFAQQQFATPEQAATALAEAISQPNEAALSELLGDNWQQFLPTDGIDPAAVDRFQRDWQVKHVIIQQGDKAWLDVGSEAWRLPVPIVKASEGWRFDMAAGEEEILTRAIEQAQTTVESRNFQARKSVLEYDDVMNKQREIIYDQRKQVLDGLDVKNIIMNMMNTSISHLVAEYFAENDHLDAASCRELLRQVEGLYFPKFTVRFTDEELKEKTAADVTEAFTAAAAAYYEQKEQEFTSPVMREVERVVLLRVVDEYWMDHIDAMADLRQGIRLRAYAQTDPIIAYKKESLDMFEEMISAIQSETVRRLYSVRIKKDQEIKRERVAKATGESVGGDGTVKKQPRRVQKIGRNDPCPCGSGKKYKNCCGRNA